MIITPLMEHQMKGLNFLKQRHRAALFWKMGTGKSLTALSYAYTINARTVLITSDKNNTLNTWPDQIMQHTDFDVVVRPKKLSLNPTGCLCVCVNYEYLARHWKTYAAHPWDLWIGDESSEFKYQLTDKHRFLYAVVQKIGHRLILNGEPMTERVEDLFGQFKMLDDGASTGSTLTKFRLRFMKPSADGYGWEARRDSLTDVRNATANLCHWLTEAPVKMPERRYHVAYVDQTMEQMDADTSLKKTFAASLNGKKIEVKHAASVFIKRAQLAGGVFRATTTEDDPGGWYSISTAKLDLVAKIVRDNPDSKIVVWHNYIPETTLLTNALEDKVIPFTYLYSNPEDPQQLQMFQKAKSGVLLIRNSLCKGLNQLADADIAIIYSNPLSYKNRVQMEGRSQRMTSRTMITHVIDILTKGGADEAIYHLLKQKKEVALTLQTLYAILCQS